MFTSKRSTALPGCGSLLRQHGLPAARLKGLHELPFKFGYAAVTPLNIPAQPLYLHAQVAVFAQEGGVFIRKAQAAGRELFWKKG